MSSRTERRPHSLDEWRRLRPEDHCHGLPSSRQAIRRDTNRTHRAVPTEFLFGTFCLLPTQFLLLEGDKPVHLGSRALEILIVLLERAGEVVSKQQLMDRVWPNVFI